MDRRAEEGYRIESGVLSPAECDALWDDLSASIVKRSRAGARHLMAVPSVARLAYDERLITIARHELATEAIPYRATLFEKSAAANWLVTWHQDTALPVTQYCDVPGWESWSQKAGFKYAHAPARALERVVALRLHLDASTSDNGPLRLVPGSHALGVLEDEFIQAAVKKRGFIECLVPKGGVLAMRPLLIHSSSKARTPVPRRVLHVEYCDDLQIEPGITLNIA